MPKLIDEICLKCGANYTTSYVRKTEKNISEWKHVCDLCKYSSGDYKSQDDAADSWEGARKSNKLSYNKNEK